MARDTDWHVVSQQGGVVTSHRYEAGPDGAQLLHVRQEFDPGTYLAQAKLERDAMAGKRWGDGRVIGRLPLPLYFSSGMAEARRQGDESFIRRFWNDPDVKNLRTFEGNI